MMMTREEVLKRWEEWSETAEALFNELHRRAPKPKEAYAILRYMVKAFENSYGYQNSFPSINDWPGMVDFGGKRDRMVH